MSGRQEEEVDEASMSEWGLWWGAYENVKSE